MRSLGWIQNEYALASRQSSEKLITRERAGLDLCDLGERDAPVVLRSERPVKFEILPSAPHF